MPRASTNCKEILRLHDKRMSQDSIVSTLHVSKKSVSNVIKSARKLSLRYWDVKDMTDEEVHALLFPEQEQAKLQHSYPDFQKLHESLALPNTTLTDEWNAFRETCSREGRGAVGYSTLCNAYADYIAEKHLPSHVLYKYGATMLCTWAAGRFPVPGTTSTAYVFLGVLPASGHVYIEVTDEKDEDTFIRCVVHMIGYIDGAVRTIGIVHARKLGARRLSCRETVVSCRTMELRRHYGIDICLVSQNDYIDSLSDELVGIIESADGLPLQALIMRVENWKSVLNASNMGMFRKEQEYLTGLPETAYDVLTEHKKELTVMKNSHVKYRGNYYSAPYQLRGKPVSLRYTDGLVEILQDGAIVAVHDRVPPFCTHRYMTDGSHMPPPSKRPAMNKERMLSLSAQMGHDVKVVAEGMFGRVAFEEQAYNSVQALLQLGKQFGPMKLNNACKVALQTKKAPGYKCISEIIKNG